MGEGVDRQGEVEERKEGGESGMMSHFEGLISESFTIVALI